MKTYQIHRDPPSKNSWEPDEKLAWWWVIPVIVAIGAIIGLTFIAFYQLPEPIHDTHNNESFITSRAKKDLEEFVTIGPKVVGGIANEQITVKYLLEKIAEIEKESIGLYNIEVDTQVASGGFVRSSFVNLYEKIQNVVVRITPKNSSFRRSVLVNSHFDTVPDSPGAGDDGAMVVVMLGVLSAMTKSKNVVKHPVVFLFNGAEENGLQGSHAFITQHKWAEMVTVFVNLDATGTGGKEILFQTGPNNPWLIDYYAKYAKHPFASVIGEEIFENELIPSDTDFRIFRDYGNKSGLDLAYVYNDYIYHTKYDDIDMIEDGTYQHTGDNVLEIVKALANADEMEKSSNELPDGKAIFFDVFGIFMINYSETVGIIVNVLLSAAAVATMALSVLFMKRSAAVSVREIHIQFGLSVGVQLIALVLAIGVVLFIAFMVDVINYSLSWYSQPWLIFGLYFIPFIFVMGLLPALFLDNKRFNSLPLRYRITLFLHAHCSILVFIVIIMTCLSIRTAFFVSQLLLFYTVAMLINLAAGWYMKNHLWIVPILISQGIPLAFVSYIMIITYSLFIPISGRSGAANNPEMLIALCSIAYSLLMFGFFIPILCIFRKTKSILVAMLVVMLIFIILMFTSVCFPYREKTSPQRQALLHTKRVMYDFEGKIRKEDAGFYAVTWDRQSAHTLNDIIKRLNLKDRDAGQDCGNELFCGLPLYHPMMLTHLSTGFWIDADPPNIRNMPSIKLVSKVNTNENYYRYTFELIGTKQNEILLKVNPGIRLAGWSFKTSDAPNLNKIEHFIHLRFGLERLPYTFHLDLEKANLSAPAVTLGLVGHFQDDENVPTESLKNLMLEFPEWSFVQGVEATYQSWQF